MTISISFYDRQLKQQIFYSLTVLISYMIFLILLKWRPSSCFPNFDGQNFSPKLNRPLASTSEW